MSRLRIQHRTDYRYERPVGFGRHRLVIRPREGHDLRILSMDLRIIPTHHLMWMRDVYGNSIAIVDFTETSSHLQFSSDVIVERWPPAAHLEREGWRTAYPIDYDSMEFALTSAYQNPTYPEEATLVREWLNSVLPLATRSDTGAMLSELCRTIKATIGYIRRSERGVQSPSTTLRLGHGSCRDMATLMLEAARILGIASRFASGYLHCSASDAGRASTHAWMEAYLPALGWCGFDPTLGETTSSKHIATGLSHHPRGVMPISGQFIGERRDFRKMTVAVTTDVLEGQ